MESSYKRGKTLADVHNPGLEEALEARSCQQCLKT